MVPTDTTECWPRGHPSTLTPGETPWYTPPQQYPQGFYSTLKGVIMSSRGDNSQAGTINLLFGLLLDQRTLRVKDEYQDIYKDLSICNICPADLTAFRF